MTKDIEQIKEDFPKAVRTWGQRRRVVVSFVLADEIKVQTLDSTVDQLNKKHSAKLGYEINRNHIVNHLIATHPLTHNTEKKLRDKRK